MNRRLVIADDTSPATGWRGEPGFLPKHHPIYHQFVGIVFVTCNDPSKLPINTAKNGFDEGSPMYHHLVNKMCEVARPLINHLSAKYDREKEGMDGEEGKVVDAIDRADEEVRTRG
ncbi:MAG: hypothetical protein SVP26_00995, partial [Chloroflexota bacterium]|nr:hypothetical protein [Chloroflexota bacterium]